MRQYDDAGRRTRVTYPDTKTVDYEYDAANQLTSVTDWLTNETTYAYNDAGGLTTTTYPNGVVATHTYDDADRLLTVTNAKTGTGTFSSFTYTLDAVGQRTQVVANNGTTTYDYDDLYRLTEVVYPGPTTHTYTYDAQGNRLTKNTDDYTYNDGDRMTDVEGVSYGYDNNGNQTSRASDTFTFDHENRMTQSVVGGVTSSSVYYGDGVRKSHTVNGTATTYQYDVLAGLPVVIQDGTYTYVYGLDLISMTDGSGNQKYFSYDGLGSVTDITNGSGTVTDTFVYDVFGAVTARSGTTVSIGKFTGEQADDGTGDSGFYFLRARHYDPATGRFVGRDKVEFAQRYAYANNNPILFTDPSGECIGLFAVACAAAVPYVAAAAAGAMVYCNYYDCGLRVPDRFGTWFADATPWPAERDDDGGAWIDGRYYEEHALDDMEERGFTPEDVEETLANATRRQPGTSQGEPATATWSQRTRATVVTDDASGNVVSIFGRARPQRLPPPRQ